MAESLSPQDFKDLNDLNDLNDLRGLAPVQGFSVYPTALPPAHFPFSKNIFSFFSRRYVERKKIFSPSKTAGSKARLSSASFLFF
ncbi:MAG: hypothetical protein J5698_05610 [Bacteroidaceae bacterium]|nr:hypothetical protein [Bacteroidaceae bacterium]